MHRHLRCLVCPKLTSISREKCFDKRSPTKTGERQREKCFKTPMGTKNENGEAEEPLIVPACSSANSQLEPRESSPFKSPALRTASIRASSLRFMMRNSRKCFDLWLVTGQVGFLNRLAVPQKDFEKIYQNISSSLDITCTACRQVLRNDDRQ